MRWTRADCCPVHFATQIVDCETQRLKKRAKYRQQAAIKKLLRRVWSSPHIPNRSAPAAGELVEPEAAGRAVAAVGPVVGRAEPEAQVALVGREVAEGRAEQAALVEPEAAAERAGLAGVRVAEEQAIPAGQGQRLSTIPTIR